MTGKILFCSTSDIFEMENIDEYDVKLQITRYTNKGLMTGFTNAKGLSPTEELLNKTNHKWKKGIFTSEERKKMENGKTHTWWDLYVEQFQIQMKQAECIANYNRLKQLLDEGKNIIAVCYCREYDKCHRSIIAYNLKADGYKVILR